MLYKRRAMFFGTGVLVCLGSWLGGTRAMGADSSLPVITIFFTVKDGKLAIDEDKTLAQTGFMASFNKLAPVGSGWTPEEVRIAYFAQINQALSGTAPFVYWFFQVDFTKRLSAVKSVSAPLEKITKAHWADYLAEYQKWQDHQIGKPWPDGNGTITKEQIPALPPVSSIDSQDFQINYGLPNGDSSPGTIFSFHSVLYQLFTSTALRSVWGQADGNQKKARDAFLKEGALSFEVLPAPTPDNMQIVVSGAPEGTEEGKVVAEANQYLAGQKTMWLYPEKLTKRLQTFFLFHGLEFTMTDIVHLPRQGAIGRVSSICFDKSVPDEDAWRKYLAGYFLSRREAAILEKMLPDEQKTKGVYHPAIAPSIDKKGHILTPGKYAYFDLSALRKLVYAEDSKTKAPYPAYRPNLVVDASYPLAQIGYEIRIEADGEASSATQPLADIVFSHKETAASAKPPASGGTQALVSTGTPPPQNGSAPGPDAVAGTNAQPPKPIPPPPEKATAAVKKEAPKETVPTDSWKPIGLSGSVGVTYLPDQGVKTVLNLEKSLDSINGGALTANLGYLKHVLGSLGYSRSSSWLGPGGIFSTQGFSNEDPRRIFFSQDVDERTTGGLAEITAPWGFANADQSLDVTLKGDWRNISLSSAAPLGASSFNVASVDGKASYFWSYDPLQPASCFYASLEARDYVECSPATVGYSREDLRVGVRHYFTDLLTYEGDAYVGVSTGGTPVFDRVSLGSADTVRTFRADYELGRSAWSLQNEFWFRVPGMDSDTSAGQGLYSTLYRQCRVSVFTDVGRAWDNVNTNHGVLIVPGAGLRFQASDRIVFKADVGYGFETIGRPSGVGTSVGLSTGYNF